VRAAYRYLLRHADVDRVLLRRTCWVKWPRSSRTSREASSTNGIDEGRFARGALPANLPAAWSRRELILNIGRYEFRKGHDVLLRAFARVREQRPAAHLLIVGTTGPDWRRSGPACRCPR